MKDAIFTIKTSDLFKAFLEDVNKELQQLPAHYLLEAVDITVSGHIGLQTEERSCSFKVWTRVFVQDAENLLNSIEVCVLRDLTSQRLPDEIKEVSYVQLHLGPAHAWTEEEVFSLVEDYCDDKAESYWMSLPRNPERPCSCYL